MNTERNRPVVIADTMSVGGDDGDEGDGGAQSQQTSGSAVSDDVQQETDADVDEPRHQH